MVRGQLPRASHSIIIIIQINPSNVTVSFFVSLSLSLPTSLYIHIPLSSTSPSHLS